MSIQMPIQDRSSAVALASVFLLMLSSVPSILSADVLVTRLGEQVETRGAWEIDGKRVVFHLQGGGLASLRMIEVDLPASHRATEAVLSAARNPEAAPPPAEPREARVVITDKDVRPVQKPAPRSATITLSSLPPKEATREDTEEKSGKEEVKSALPATRLVVASWEREHEDGRTVVSGELRNDAPADARRVSITALLYDSSGRLLASDRAVLSSTVLPAGQTAGFQAVFPAVSGGSSIRFEVRGIHPFPDKSVTTGSKARS